MSQEKTKVNVKNDSQLPISNLIVAHWQEIGDESQWDKSLSKHEYNYLENKNKPLSNWSFDINDEAKHNNYWIVVWFDFHGKTIQFLKDESDGGWLKELEKDLMKEVDNLMGDLIDELTESDFGTIAAKILNKAIDKIRKNRGVGIVEDKINSDNPIMDITINCNAYHKNKSNFPEVKFESGHHNANCTIFSYYKKGSACNP
jgi:hypothetical protein